MKAYLTVLFTLRSVMLADFPSPSLMYPTYAVYSQRLQKLVAISLNNLWNSLGLINVGSIWDNVSTQLYKLYDICLALFDILIQKCYIL